MTTRVDSLAGRLMRVDPNDGSVLGSVPLPGHWVHRAPSGELWVAGLKGTVIRLRPGGQADGAEEDPAR